MRFQMTRNVTGGAAADPDPRGAPATVGTIPDEALMVVPLTIRNSDTVPGRLLLALEGTAAQVMTVEIWAQEDVGADRQAGMPEMPTQAQKQARLFYEASPTAVVTVTVGELVEFPAAADELMPMPGTLYVRVVAAPAADSVLKVAPGN